LMSASEMPGATATMDVDPDTPIALKADMIPQTVPKRPMNGQAAAVVARNVSHRVRRDTSAPAARSSARSMPLMFLMRSRMLVVAAVAGSSERAALIWASSSAYPDLKRVVSGVSAS
jgi:hypothetical protein